MGTVPGQEDRYRVPLRFLPSSAAGHARTLELDQKNRELEQQISEREQMGLELTNANEKLTVWASAGVAAYPQSGDQAGHILEAADAVLYQAKARGRDQVVVAEPVGIHDQDSQN